MRWRSITTSREEWTPRWERERERAAQVSTVSVCARVGRRRCSRCARPICGRDRFHRDDYGDDRWSHGQNKKAPFTERSCCSFSRRRRGHSLHCWLISTGQSANQWMRWPLSHTRIHCIFTCCELMAPSSHLLFYFLLLLFFSSCRENSFHCCCCCWWTVKVPVCVDSGHQWDQPVGSRS